MKIKFYLREPEKKGVTAIYASICYNNNRIIVFPGESIHTSDWINEDGRNEPRDIARNATLIGNLLRARLRYMETYDNLKLALSGIVPPDVFKKAIYNKQNPPQVKVEKPVRISITDFIKRTINDTKNGSRLSDKKLKLKADSIKPYNSTFASYKAYELDRRRTFYIDEISQKLLDDYDRYLTQVKKLALNTKSKYLKTFMLVLRYGVERKVADKNIVENIKLCLRSERSDSIYLNDSEIEDLLKITEFKSPTHEVVLEYFLLGCKTGLRYSDYSRIKPEHINNGMIQITQKKVMERVTVPIHPIVANILAKYPNGLPRCIANQPFNEYLKEICEPIASLQKVFEKKITRGNEVVTEKFKKWQLVTSHTCRRSFATNEYRNGTPIITIMAITGHKSEKTFLNYIKMDGEEHAELLGQVWKQNKKKPKK